MQLSYLVTLATLLFAGNAYAAVVERQSCPLMCNLEFFADADPVKGDAAYENCIAAAATAYHGPGGACDPSCEKSSSPSGWYLNGVQGNGYSCID